MIHMDAPPFIIYCQEAELSMNVSTDVHEQWRLLFAYVDSVRNNIAIWKNFFRTFDAGQIDPMKIGSWFDKIDTCMEVLKRRYAYDVLSRLNVNPCGSGFPLLHDIRIVGGEYDALCEGRQKSVVTAKDLRREFVEHIYDACSVNYALLEKISKMSGQELLMRSEPLRVFHFANIQEVASANGQQAYVCFWECWDNRCIPSLYAMLFEYHAETDWNSEIMQECMFVLREETTHMPLLARLAKNVDIAITSVRPKWIGRVTFGPIFVSHVTRDDIPLQKIIDRVAQNGELISASRVIHEYIISESEEGMSGLRDAKGRKHTVLQQFAVRESDDECRAREATHVEKYLTAPHAVVQLLDDSYRKEINHEII